MRGLEVAIQWEEGRGGSSPGLYHRNKRNKQSTKTTEIKTEKSWTWRGRGQDVKFSPFPPLVILPVRGR